MPQRVRTSRAIGNPAAPARSDIPSVAPAPKSTIKRSPALRDGRRATTSAVSAPLPASPWTIPIANGPSDRQRRG